MTTISFCLLLAGQDAVWSRRLDNAVPTVTGYRRDRAGGPADDGEFLRRAMLDLVGTPPSADEARAFLDDPQPDKRSRLVQRLTDSDAFARFWARRIADFLLDDGLVLPFAEDHPVYKLSFVGRADPFPMMIAGHLPRHVLGIDFTCAVCHDHPFDRWTIDDAWSIAAYFAGQKPRFDAAGGSLAMDDDASVPFRWPFKLENRIEPPFQPRWFLGAEAKVGDDRPSVLARLLSEAAPEQLDRAFANRVWAWLFGRGVVHPVDEFDMRNKPRSKRLLDELTAAFRENGRSIRTLARILCTTRTYGLSSENADAAWSPRLEKQVALPLSPEQLVNALQTATLGAPRRDPAEIERLTGLFSGGRRRGCEVRPLPAGTIHALFLRNSEELAGWISEGPVLKRLRETPAQGRVEELFLAALGRRPSAAERERFDRFVAAAPTGLEDALWVLLNTAEFLTRS